MAVYPDFVKTTGYGTIIGLGGINCRHHFYPFIEGVSERTYTDKQLEEMKGENHAFTYEGKEYDGYTATQKQREIERTIRKYKRVAKSYKAAGLEDEATTTEMKLQRLNTAYTEFSNAAGLRKKLSRTYVEK